ncbi:MAG: hypothetical protein L0Z73_14610 [Gammaproteobacteria bacterium]|nr:hypothetical protein [Gammaproteobacteria bacterium]
MPEINEDLIAQAKEKLLDPFEPVFPMPGMWHFIFGSVFSLVVFGGGLTYMLDYFELRPEYEIATVFVASLSVPFLIILGTIGNAWAVGGLRFIAISSTIIIGTNVIVKGDVNVFDLAIMAFGAVSYYLLSCIESRALVNIMAIRRVKIKQMKKDGTYKQKLEEARKRWR